MTLPAAATLSSRHVLTGSADGALTDSPPMSSKSSSLPRAVDSSPNNQRHGTTDPATPPMIRSFTFTDPLMKPKWVHSKPSGVLTGASLARVSSVNCEWGWSFGKTTVVTTECVNTLYPYVHVCTWINAKPNGPSYVSYTCKVRLRN